MQLVLSNAQGELSPLEIGVHVLQAVPPAVPGPKADNANRGLSEYAERIQRSQQYISQLRSAAKVIQSMRSTSQLVDLLNKTQHLYEISRADESTWPTLCELLINRSWTVADVRSNVDKIKKFNIPPQHSTWLPYGPVAVEYLRRDRLNPVVNVA
jgi:hypothetical protein